MAKHPHKIAIVDVMQNVYSAFLPSLGQRATQDPTLRNRIYTTLPIFVLDVCRTVAEALGIPLTVVTVVFDTNRDLSFHRAEHVVVERRLDNIRAEQK